MVGAELRSSSVILAPLPRHPAAKKTELGEKARGLLSAECVSSSGGDAAESNSAFLCPDASVPSREATPPGERSFPLGHFGKSKECFQGFATLLNDDDLKDAHQFSEATLMKAFCTAQYESAHMMAALTARSALLKEKLKEKMVENANLKKKGAELLLSRHRAEKNCAALEVLGLVERWQAKDAECRLATERNRLEGLEVDLRVERGKTEAMAALLSAKEAETRRVTETLGAVELEMSSWKWKSEAGERKLKELEKEHEALRRQTHAQVTKHKEDLAKSEERNAVLATELGELKVELEKVKADSGAAAVQDFKQSREFDDLVAARLKAFQESDVYLHTLAEYWESGFERFRLKAELKFKEVDFSCIRTDDNDVQPSVESESEEEEEEAEEEEGDEGEGA